MGCDIQNVHTYLSTPLWTDVSPFSPTQAEYSPFTDGDTFFGGEKWIIPNPTHEKTLAHFGVLAGIPCMVFLFDQLNYILCVKSHSK